MACWSGSCVAVHWILYGILALAAAASDSWDHADAARLSALSPVQQDGQYQQQTSTMPSAAWMANCCSQKKLRQLYLPGTHDSGTYAWTLPQHLPMVIDEVAVVLFNIVGDLSRTQKLTVYEQLAAGARVLDLRLAVNPWIAVQARLQQHSSSAMTAATQHQWRAWSSHLQHQQAGQQQWASQAGLKPNWQGRSRAVGYSHSSQHQDQSAGQQPQLGSPARDTGLQGLQAVLTLDADQLEGSINYQAVGGLLNHEELKDSLVASHSLPGARLTEMLGDVTRFLSEHPTEVIVMMVKPDTLDVNVAGQHRMSPTAWQAAVRVFAKHLQGVKLLHREQVEQQTLAELTNGEPGGAVLVCSDHLSDAGLPAVRSEELQILESWGNGTNTEEVAVLRDKLAAWLKFWQAAAWKHHEQPFMLLASAEVTLGVRSIMQLIKSRIWPWLTNQQQQKQKQVKQQLQAANLQQQRQSLLQYQQQHSMAWQHELKVLLGKRQQLMAPENNDASINLGSLGGVSTLYQLGVEANQQLLQELLVDNKVANAFSIWSFDAFSADMAAYIVNLNMEPIQPTKAQQR